MDPTEYRLQMLELEVETLRRLLHALGVTPVQYQSERHDVGRRALDGVSPSEDLVPDGQGGKRLKRHASDAGDAPFAA